MHEPATATRVDITSAPVPGPADGAAVARGLGPVTRLLYALIFSRLQFDRAMVARIRDAAARGSVVYALARLGRFERALLHWMLRAFELPPARDGDVLGLDGHRGLDAAAALIARQAPHDRPFVIVGVTALWGQRPFSPPTRGPWLGALARLFGDLGSALRHRRRSLVIAAEPVDLKALGSVEPAALVELLRSRIETERRVRIGAPHRTPAALLERVLRSDAVVAAMQEEATGTGETDVEIERKARLMLEQMQAKKSATGLNRISWVLRRSWGRLFDGFTVDEAGIERIRAAAAKGPVLLLPTHRSHVDYLLMSDLFVARDLVPPHIAAGLNLAFWPMGWIFRTAGAFFLRRRYAGRELYGTLMHGYLGEVIAEGHNIEIFIEGGRSRTGRVLTPRFGLLSVIADHAVRAGAPAVHVVPASIGYDRVVEAKALTRELAGGVKEPESLAKVLRIPSIFRSRPQHGRINVQIGDPFDLRTFLAERGYDGPDVSADTRHGAIRALGYHVLGHGSALTAVTGTSLVAAAVLASASASIDRRHLDGATRFIADLARAGGARFAIDERRWADELDRAIELLRTDGALLVEGSGNYQRLWAEGQGRIRLDYYKNQMAQHIVAPAIAAAAIRALLAEDDGRIRGPRLVSTARRLASIARHHFVHHAGDALEDLIDRTLEQFVHLELVTRDRDDTYTLVDSAFEGIRMLAGTFESLIEAQIGVTRAVSELAGTPRTRRELESEVISDLHRQHAAGELKRLETCQMPLVAAAIDWLCHEGMLVQCGDDVSLPDVEATREVADRLSAMLPAKHGVKRARPVPLLAGAAEIRGDVDGPQLQA